MNMKSMRYLFSGVALCSLLALFSSCEEKDYTSRMPVFSGFVMTPEVVTPGDSVTIIAKQATKGTLLNGTDYQWTITNSSDSVVFSEKSKVTYDHQPEDPKIVFHVPVNLRPGTYWVNFYAKYRYSGQGSVYNGSLNNGSMGGLGTFTGTSSAIYGECRGEFTFKIQ